ncbi:nucleolar MIF4G domain-containing protein 1 [Megachile rotundata]|uniref:nucleolar MIF4G domain-containing protein 1 n=1 Tax=Megachile rotundata TaxID=143995 RepID=UPI000614ECCA|nr:PREDICTED: nucleolar MIF4G domain-containing protein 1 [Megachile rotundata]
MSSFKRSKLKNKNAKNASINSIDKSRKQVRKELRKQKKVNKAIYFQKKNKTLVSYSDEHEKGIKVFDDKNIYDSDNGNTDEIQRKSVQKKKSKKVEFKKQSRRSEALKRANLKEDKEIKKLEKQLKLNKRKKNTIPKSFALDGLDYLLDFCLENDRKDIVEREEKFLVDKFDNEFEGNLTKNVEDTIKEKDASKQNEMYNTNKNENTNDHSTLMVEKNIIKNKNVDKLDLKKSKIKEVTSKENKKNVNIGDGSWEDIYGRKRDRDGNIIQDTKKYIPPAAKVTARDTNPDNEKLYHLRKQLKGYLNRVTEHNIHYISNQIETMYMTNSRNNMNLVLSELTMESLITNVITPNRLICEHMMLIAILHANVGIEVGANFLEKLIKKFVEIMEKPQNIENKELDNIILMISHLYNFKVYGHQLIYQILNKLAIKFTEKEIELILLVLKTVGFSLRKDDPIALKEFIKDLQQKASHENGENSRVKFMLEILLAIKNNNVNKIPQYDPSQVEHLKKVMKSVIRKGNDITQFNVTLEDLLHADEIGKWWIIGSAWSGTNTIDNSIETNKSNKLNFGKKILELAKKQRMNTDTRRNIFCILITAEDYLDAFEKFHHLGLKDQQEGEIVHVLMHCCLQENKFNPYYAILARKLCEYNRKYQLTIQYTLWDKLKTLETYESNQLNNLAQFLTYLFIENCLAISVLKVIQFTELDKHTMKFLKQIISEILLHENEEACLRVFERISVSPQLQTFKESLRLFINCFLTKNTDSCNIPDKQKLTMKRRVELVDKILISHESKIMF